MFLRAHVLTVDLVDSHALFFTLYAILQVFTDNRSLVRFRSCVCLYEFGSSPLMLDRWDGCRGEEVPFCAVRGYAHLFIDARVDVLHVIG